MPLMTMPPIQTTITLLSPRDQIDLGRHSSGAPSGSLETFHSSISNLSLISKSHSYFLGMVVVVVVVFEERVEREREREK